MLPIAESFGGVVFARSRGNAEISSARLYFLPATLVSLSFERKRRPGSDPKIAAPVLDHVTRLSRISPPSHLVLKIAADWFEITSSHFSIHSGINPIASPVFVDFVRR